MSDDYAELRKGLGKRSKPRYEELEAPSRWPKPKPWHVLLGGFLLASVTTWTWLSIGASWAVRGGATCHPNPRFKRPPTRGCGAEVPPPLVLLVITVLSVAWLLWVTWQFMRGGPSGGGFFAIRALQERGEIVYHAIVGGALAGLLVLYGWALAWGPGGIIGQVLIGTPKWLFAGGPRTPAIILAFKVVIVFVGSVKIVGSVSIDTQGS